MVRVAVRRRTRAASGLVDGSYILLTCDGKPGNEGTAEYAVLASEVATRGLLQ